MIKSVKLGEIARISSGGTPSRANPSYWNGNIPWVKTTQIQNCVITPQDVDEWITEEGLKNSSAKMVPAGTIVLGMIGQGKTRGQVGYLSFDACTNQNAATITCNNECDSWFIYQYLLFNYENIRALSNSSGQGNLNLGLVEIIPITLPPLSQQKKIANLLGTWDNAIEKTEALIAAKEKQFEWLTSNLINRAGHKRTSASGLMTEVSKRNKNSTIERVLSVTNHSGFVLPEEQFERRVASANVSNYKIVEQGQYAYNPSRINVGSIARLDDWENGILSPMYVVFKLDTKKVCSDYFLHWLNSSEARQRIKNSAQGSVRETVSFKDLGAIDIPLPAMDVQKDVTYKLNLAQKEISLLKKTLEQYRSQKRGLMQKLLTGEWQVGSSQHLSEETYQEASA
ncbi:restriction endonuclease subunit S [Shewanella sp. GD03713]|uniref:restriction endonuclease subunit S n=1 Tax=Shewanella sp. GD03713 TaxID=2975372 RepID=UPI00244ACF2A|nr:restriction endonuclease subunit S [Shewanella sp. GD03713]MDH1472062.1 restriction endonuclease subunit S [Shewanella sp. GD03713]